MVHWITTSQGVRHKLRKSQQIFLYILSTVDGPITKEHIMYLNTTMRPKEQVHIKGGKTHYDYTFTDAIGAFRPEYRERNERRNGYPSLITLGLCSCFKLAIEMIPTYVYLITDEGKQIIDEIADDVFREYFS